VLYAFAGKCCTTSIRAAAFRLTRNAHGRFQVESFQPFSAPLNDFSGVGAVNGQLWTGLGKVIYRYDYTTNTFSDSFTMAGVSGNIDGMGFSPDGTDLWVVNNTDTLYRINWSTRTIYPNHVFNLAPVGITDSRAVEVVGNRLFICDGYDFYPTGSPDRYAIKVYKLVDLGGAVASTAAVSATPPPAVVTNSDSVSPPQSAVSAIPSAEPAPDPVQVTDGSSVETTSEASTTVPASAP